MLGLESDDEDLNNAMEKRVEQRMTTVRGGGRMAHREQQRVMKPKPYGWDSDFDGSWENEPGAWVFG